MADGSRSLYRAYRPTSFDEQELVGQEAVARTLRNAIRTGRVAHAYLFCGPRGTGKTSTARLLAKAVNCEHPDADQRPCNACRACQRIGMGENRSVDIIEIDAASNRGIDDVRELRERINFSPSELTYKFYIIDEVHQLSEAAANALLKTLEEPPPHAKFVLATTDPQKMLATIVSRCQVFRFRRIPLDRMVARLRHVCAAEGVTADDEALATIARQATGSLRDALGLLDKAIAYGEEHITRETVQTALGIHGDERVVALIDAVIDGDLAEALTVVNDAIADGVEPRQFTVQVVEYLREVLLTLAGGNATMPGLAPTREAAQARQAGRTSLRQVADLIQRLSAIDHALERGSHAALPLELALVEASLAQTATPPPPAAAASARAVPARPTATRAASPAPAARTVAEAPPALAPTHPLPSSDPPPLPDTTVPEPPPSARAASDRPAARVASAPSPAGALPPLPDLWQLVTRDINARDKPFFAILRDVEPLGIDGQALILTTAYPFHYDQLRQEGRRAQIEAAVERVVQRHLQVRCVPANEADTHRARLATAEPSRAPAAEEPSASPPAPPPPATRTAPTQEAALVGAPPRGAADRPDPAQDEARVRAARNIFDAYPVGDDET